MGAATIPPTCGRYASFLPAEAIARIFGTNTTTHPSPGLASNGGSPRRGAAPGIGLS
jgi:hypothetical protein